MQTDLTVTNIKSGFLKTSFVHYNCRLSGLISVLFDAHFNRFINLPLLLKL